MRRPVPLLLLLTLSAVCFTAGCRSNPRRDLTEAELRVKDKDLRELRSELERSDAYNQYLQRELRNLSGIVPHTAGESPPPAVGVPASRAKSVTLGRQTGGIDEDNFPGDEALQVVLEPKDADNHIVKVLGTAQIHALEITAEGVKKPLSSWQVDNDMLRRSWRTGLLSTGYFLTLPWKNWPASTKVRVVVQFVADDQRLYEADKDVTIRLAPSGIRKSTEFDPGPYLPPLPPPTPLPTQPELDMLPPPRPVEPEKKPYMPPAEAMAQPVSLEGAVQMLKPVVTRD